ncbi:hypothetical protein HOLleu_04906 [Holothuria leucospilota]|uniref:Uncharacterized protein n=1 Tax=Holothuria leucospilota TaxID=206669 RepID=A0A9Q1CJY1_HOLLE|nr:hypothetical protein HOLleu_04906 [Holothuria leucospilota]
MELSNQTPYFSGSCDYQVNIPWMDLPFTGPTTKRNTSHLSGPIRVPRALQL